MAVFEDFLQSTLDIHNNTESVVVSNDVAYTHNAPYDGQHERQSHDAVLHNRHYGKELSREHHQLPQRDYHSQVNTLIVCTKLLV